MRRVRLVCAAMAVALTVLAVAPSPAGAQDVLDYWKLALLNAKGNKECRELSGWMERETGVTGYSSDWVKGQCIPLLDGVPLA